MTRSLKREVISLAHDFDNTILTLELFKNKAEESLPIFQEMIEELELDKDTNDDFRIIMIKRLVEHLRKIHEL